MAGLPVRDKIKLGFLGSLAIKNLPAMKETLVEFPGMNSFLEKEWLPIPVYLPGKSHRQRSLVGCSPWGHKRAGHDLATKQQQQK